MMPLIIIQARLNSSRLPHKVLKPILEKPLLLYAIERLKKLSTVANLVVATTDQTVDDPIELFCKKQNVTCFRGDENHVLKRFYDCIKRHPTQTVVRITGDCPLVDVSLLHEMLNFYLAKSPQYDYISNVLKRSYPKGCDIEIFSFKALHMAYLYAQDNYQKEHVTPYIYQHPEIFNLYNFQDREDFSHYNISVDTMDDFILVEKIITNFYPQNPYFGLNEIKSFLKQNSGASLGSRLSS